MPRVDREVDNVVDLEQQLEIARYKALHAVGKRHKQSTRQNVEKLERLLADLRQSSRSAVAIDDDHPDFTHLD